MLSPISFAMLSGAGLVKGNEDEEVHFHQTSNLIASSTDGSIDLSNALEPGEKVDIDAPLFILYVDKDGDLTGEMVSAYYTLNDAQDKLILKDGVYGQQNAYFETIDQPAKDINLSTSKWASVAVVETDLNNDIQDWRYAAPLNDEQIIRNSAPNRKTWSVSGYSKKSSTSAETAKPIIVNNSASISYRYMLETDGILKGKIDALYTLADDLSVIPYNLSHLDITFDGADEGFASSAGESVLYSLPTPTIAVNLDGSPALKADIDNNYCLRSATAIRNAISVEAMTALVTYLVGGSTALGTGSDLIANKKLIKDFLITQAALQYYTYSYVKEYSERKTNEVHTHTFADLTSAFLLFGFNAKSVFVQKNSTTAKAFIKKNNEYEETIDSEKISYYQGRGLAEYNGIKMSYKNAEAFKNTSGKAVMVDYYVVKKADTVSELQIDAANFAGYYYVEADTLFRRQFDGVDLPANITFPNVKIQSNFTFSMAPTGDPSTFSFTMDAMPGYTYFDKTKKVLCAIQIVDDKS
ncbi:MAG: hypothetical protein II567_11805 [Candidatus Riflebacteria bacterium]|nr:hypothetical protein [Candidatus Riflebacteria bacterium]